MFKQSFTAKNTPKIPLQQRLPRHWLLLLSALLTFGCTAEADVEAGKAAAGACQACHGKDGIGLTPQTPNLAGQKQLYLSNQLIAYRSGTRKNNIMSPLAKPLSDEDIANLAAYYASLPAAGSR
jgi:cytochrome c553